MLLFYLCSCVCVFCGSVGCSIHGKREFGSMFHSQKKGESVMTPNVNNENLNHLFTGTTLHTPLAVN
jgi:hypothetical protein